MNLNPIPNPSSRGISGDKFQMWLRRSSVQSPFNLIWHRLLSSSINDDIQKVFGIISTTATPKQLKKSLKSSGVFLSNELIDGVLKRVCFSHGNPSQTLEFFRYTRRRKGFYHTAFSLDTMLYVLGRNRMFLHVWDLLIEARWKDQSFITTCTVMVVLGKVAKVCFVRQIMELFRRFRKLVSEFDTNYFNALLRTLCQEKSMTDVRNVYHSLKYGFRPNLQTFNILLSGWKASEDAQGFFKEMREQWLKP